MPIDQQKTPLHSLKVDEPYAASEYKKLVAYIELASGFDLAVARCNLPFVRDRIIDRLRTDDRLLGVNIERFAVSEDGDLASQLARVSNAATGTRLALMVIEIERLLYRKDASSDQLNRSRYVESLNVQREGLSRVVSCPIVLWLDNEAVKLLFALAPDLSQWISARFDFAQLGAEYLFSERPRLQFPSSIPAQPPKLSTDVDALQKEISSTGFDEPRRMRLLLTLGERYLESARWRRAQECFESVIQISTALQDTRSELQARFGLGTIFYRSRPGRAITSFKQALQIAKQLGDKSTEARCLMYLGLLEQRKGHHQSAIELLNSALELAQSLSMEDLTAQLHDFRGMARAGAGEFSTAMADFEEGLQRARSLGNIALQVELLTNQGLTFMWFHKPERAIGILQESLEMARANALENQVLAASRGLAWAYTEKGEWRRALSYFDQAITTARRLRNTAAELDLLDSIALAALSAGDYTYAIEISRTALATAISRRNLKAELQALERLGHSYLMSDRPLDAIQHFQQAFAIAQHFQDLLKQFDITANLGKAYESIRQYSLAIEYLQKAFDLSKGISESTTATVELELARVLVTAGETSRAVDVCNDLIQRFEHLGDASGKVHAILQLALAYEVAGDYVESDSAFDRAVQEAEMGGDLYLKVMILWNRAYALHKRGDIPRAVATLNSALAIGDRLPDVDVSQLHKTRQAWQLEPFGAAESL